MKPGCANSFAIAVIALISTFAAMGLARAQEAAIPARTERHIVDYDEMKARRIVRILVPFSKTIYFIDRGRELGTAVEFGHALEESINAGTKKEIERVRVLFVPTPRDRLLDAYVERPG